MARDRRSRSEIAAKNARDREAAVALRRSGKSAGETAKILGLSGARRVRELCAGVDLDAAPDPAPTAASKPGRRKVPRRKLPPRRAKGQPELGKMLRPIILEPSRGGFGIAPETVSAAGLGPNTPLDGYGDPMGDGRHLKKVGESIVDMGTTVQHDQRRYDARREADAARNDPDPGLDLDDLDIPADAARAIFTYEDGSERVIDL